MNYADITKKNNDIIQPKIKKEEVKKEIVVYNKYSDLVFKDVEDEFDFKYLRNITDISIDFRDYINKNYLPFMDKIIGIEYHIYDFLKYNSKEYHKTLKHVEEYNNNLIEEYDKELEEIEKELAEEQYISD
jgi:RNase adaptor protein for sRNA GlmZ degradation|tara:strand:+ start:5645 stop:6037 length:393 start_codon:yes stop_codon:yes gene_type:complete